ncbi:MAG TPA: AraC family transcriptional regulator [Gammaproteobacteria bacterium]|jgi:AraC family transcriptional regulator|nr:AraC family transcriptional regulator [Gammaproteobacteria bacterium]
MSAAAVSRIYARYDDSRKLYLPDVPVFSDGRHGSYIFERQQVFSAGHTPTHAFDEHIFMLPLGDAAVPFHSRLNGRPLKGLIEPERFRFVSAGDTLSTTWEAPLEGIFVTLHPDVLRRALGEDSAHPAELISNVMPHRDDLLAHLTLAMQSYLLADRVAGAIFEQSLLTAIAAHLVDAYGHGRRSKPFAAPLTRRNRTRAEDYIRQNLARDLNLAAIAAVVDMSPHQLSRTFRAATGQSLWQFVIELRAREAKRLMMASPSLPLSHVAQSSGFETYSQFIAAFRKVFGQLPSEYRRTHGA